MKPNLENVKKKIQENRDLADRITAKFPGFKGYVEKAESYDADKLVRNLVAEKLQNFKNDSNAKSSDLAKKGEHALMPEFDSVSIKLETIIKKCQHADFGALSSTPGRTVTEDDKNRLLEYDWRLVSDLDVLEKIINEISAAPPDAIGGILGDFGKRLKEFEKNFDERKNVLLEVL